MDYTPIAHIEQLLQAEIDFRRNTKPDMNIEPLGSENGNFAYFGSNLFIGTQNTDSPAHHYRVMPLHTHDNNTKVEICNYSYSDEIEQSPLFNKVREETETVIKKTCAGTQPLLKINVSGISDVHNLQYGNLIPYSLISDLYYKKACMEDYIGRLEARITQLEANSKV